MKALFLALFSLLLAHSANSEPCADATFRSQVKDYLSTSAQVQRRCAQSSQASMDSVECEKSGEKVRASGCACGWYSMNSCGEAYVSDKLAACREKEKLTASKAASQNQAIGDTKSAYQNIAALELKAAEGLERCSAQARRLVERQLVISDKLEADQNKILDAAQKNPDVLSSGELR